MARSSDTHGNDAQDVKGWDTDAFWYPTLDRHGALLGLFFLLLVLHFDEIFGIAGSSWLVFGWWPATMAYHVGINLLHVAFMVLIYLNWPEPKDEDLDRPGVATAETGAGAAGTAAAEGD